MTDSAVTTSKMFSWSCPECEKRGRKDTDCTVHLEYNKEWVFKLYVDCSHTSDHCVRIEGAWSNPLVRLFIEGLGLTKRQLTAIKVSI